MTEGILIFTQRDVLIHKMKDGKKDNSAYCYWAMSRFPKKFTEEIESKEDSKRIKFFSDKLEGTDLLILRDFDFDFEIFDVRKKDIRLYLAVDGKVRGYFHISVIAKNEEDKHYELRFYSDDWFSLDFGEQPKSSQGFRYYLHNQD